jgi:hypothetical protein
LALPVQEVSRRADVVAVGSTHPAPRVLVLEHAAAATPNPITIRDNAIFCMRTG